MALLHHATLPPSKPELLAAWLPSQPWATGLSGLKPFGGYRLDDPDNEVGMEGILLRSDAGDVLHVPLTYRAAPLEGADAYLLGTMEHSALGTRWVYDATGDPVWRATLAATVLTGGTGAEEYFEEDGVRETREPSVQVAGSGAVGGEVPSDTEIVLVRRVGEDVEGDAVRAGSWDGGSGILAAVRIVG
jgi:hypothetical protein